MSDIEPSGLEVGLLVVLDPAIAFATLSLGRDRFGTSDDRPGKEGKDKFRRGLLMINAGLSLSSVRIESMTQKAPVRPQPAEQCTIMGPADEGVLCSLDS